MNWLVAAAAVLSALGGLGGLGGMLMVRANRRRIEAQADQIKATADESIAGTVKILVGSATDLVQPLQRAIDGAEARAERLAGRLQQLETQVEVMSLELRRIRAAILAPDVTIEELRRLVQPPAPTPGP